MHVALIVVAVLLGWLLLAAALALLLAAVIHRSDVAVEALDTRVHGNLNDQPGRRSEEERNGAREAITE